MKILLLGSGGREHALAWKIAQSKKCEKLYIAPGNAGTENCGENVAIGVNEFDKLKDFAIERQIDMVVVGPEDPLVNGIYDTFKDDSRTERIAIIGPSKAVPYWRAAKISPRLSCSDTISPQPPTKPLIARVLPKVWHS